MTDTDDQINEAVHLPKGESIITEERAAKGDLLIERHPPTKEQEDRGDPGNIRYAQLLRNNVLNHLHRIGVLSAQHVHDGQTYEVWQLIFRARTGYRDNPIYRQEVREAIKAVEADHLDQDDFVKLIRSLSLPQKRAIEFAIYTHATDHIVWIGTRPQVHFVPAFDRLSEVMQRLREEWLERQKQESACIPHQPR